MELNKIRIWPWVGLPLVAVLAYAGLTIFQHSTRKLLSVSPPSAVRIQVGSQLPDFQITPLGEDSRAVSSLGAKLYLVNFWASWCEACMVEMPSIARLHQKLKPLGLEVLAINVDSKPEVVVPPLLRKLALPFRIYTDTDQKLSDLFQVEAIPLTLILNKDREILMIHRGEEDWSTAQMTSQFERWMKSP